MIDPKERNEDEEIRKGGEPKATNTHHVWRSSPFCGTDAALNPGHRLDQPIRFALCHCKSHDLSRKTAR